MTVTVTDFRSKQVSVIGAVTNPGTYQMIGPRTVLQMISEAGGYPADATQRTVKVETFNS